MKNDEKAAVDHLLVTLTNRLNEMDERIADMEYNVDAAIFLLKTFIESSVNPIKGDT